MLEVIVNWIVNAIDVTGYLGVFILMLLESALIPIPSEIIMPFAGYLVFTGRFGFWMTVIAGTLGNLAGSLIAYWIGVSGGRKFVSRYGRFLFISKHDMKRSERLFKKYGDPIIFFSRLMPAVRTFISLPAGFAKMDLKKFVVYTTIGSFFWSILLCWIGVRMGASWESLMSIFRRFDIIILVIAIILFYIWKRRK